MRRNGMNWGKEHTRGIVGLALLILLVGLVGPLISKAPAMRVVVWLVTLALLAISIAIAGDGITGRAAGWLIDNRNMMSLSRLQMMLWTIVILSGYLAAALSNVASGQAEPLSIAIPGELWLAMGIST